MRVSISGVFWTKPQRIELLKGARNDITIMLTHNYHVNTDLWVFPHIRVVVNSMATAKNISTLRHHPAIDCRVLVQTPSIYWYGREEPQALLDAVLEVDQRLQVLPFNGSLLVKDGVHFLSALLLVFWVLGQVVQGPRYTYKGGIRRKY